MINKANITEITGARTCKIMNGQFEITNIIRIGLGDELPDCQMPALAAGQGQLSTTRLPALAAVQGRSHVKFSISNVPIEF